MNSCQFIGWLTKDPEYKEFPNGSKRCIFKLVIRRRFWDPNSEVDYATIVCWGVLAEKCRKILSKGSLVAVKGALRTRTFENSQGMNVFVSEFEAEEVSILRFPTKKTPQQEQPTTVQSKEVSNEPNYSDLDVDQFEKVFQ